MSQKNFRLAAVLLLGLVVGVRWFYSERAVRATGAAKDSSEAAKENVGAASGNAEAAEGFGAAARPSGATAVTDAALMTMMVDFRSDAIYRFQLESHQVSRMPMQGLMVEQILEQTQQFRLDLLTRRTDGGADVRWQMESLKAKIDAGGLVVEFDSERDQAENAGHPILLVLASLLEYPLVFELDADWNVRAVDGLEEARTGLRDQGRAAAATLFDQMLPLSAVEQMFDEATLVASMPSEPVSVGSSWTKTGSRTTPMGVADVNSVYRLAGMEDRNGRSCVRVVHEGPISLGSPPNVRSIGTASGGYWFDPQIGQVVELTNHRNMTLTIAIPGQEAQGEVTERLTVQLLDITPLKQTDQER